MHAVLKNQHGGFKYDISTEDIEVKAAAVQRFEQYVNPTMECATPKAEKGKSKAKPKALPAQRRKALRAAHGGAARVARTAAAPRT